MKIEEKRQYSGTEVTYYLLYLHYYLISIPFICEIITFGIIRTILAYSAMEELLEKLNLTQKLSDYRLQKLRLLLDVNFPNRDIHLKLTESLISITEKELESFNQPTATTQLLTSEKQLVMELQMLLKRKKKMSSN